ncbi:MAG: hypothetical protein JSR98_05885 [Proteobacteria bacterium]|nr:hypothetical protein [Pseudomonadota bacterium]
MSLTFRCPKELEGLLPPPTPAAQGLPGWVRAMPAQAYSAVVGGDDDTVKRCPPFIDAMTCGFLIPLFCDVRVENGEFSWDCDLPTPLQAPFARAPIGLHDAAQVAGTPLFEPDRFLIKFHNLWTVEAPAGWSLMFTHPLNRFDLPFTTLTGLVDCDRFHDAFINFPAYWRDPDFSGVLPKGTPVAQCLPIKRETWELKTEAFSEADALATQETLAAIGREKGVYRRRVRG